MLKLNKIRWRKVKIWVGHRSRTHKGKKGNSYDFYIDIGEGLALKMFLKKKDSFYAPVAGFLFKDKNKPTTNPTNCSRTNLDDEVEHKKISIDECSKIDLFRLEDM